MPRRTYGRDRPRPPHDETFARSITRNLDKEKNRWKKTTTTGPTGPSRRN